ncbi:MULTISPECIES: D-alanine--D-alanine ligase [Rhodobacterales]|uniref:D-alanine--D-alanine ligase n=1 Tax=Roseobacter sp. N2S TaxID=2663844 RepID=UPI00286473C1|nr:MULTISPECIES: D-alanine--D-alanine ligase [Rhodobacterales]MDR6264760.1 D-alanine-D-alanine ligase [Roseobacter sp. N2S]
MSSRAFHRVTVLQGGPSAEREVSLSSGHEVAKALRTEGYEVTELDAGPNLVADLRATNPDVVFNALHGRWGEDGCVQGVLEWMRVPYTHSGVFASALAMDKEKSKQAFAAAGLPIVEGRLVPKADVSRSHPMQPPYVVKPYNEGSSVGVYLVHESANGPAQISADMPDLLMVEKFVPGRELTTTVMGDKALTVTDIITEGWYDYDAKYKIGGSRHEVPANVPADVFEACLDYALRAHNALGCRGLSRTDFRWDDTKGLDGLILLETNTQPGMTPTSLAPEQAAICGIDFGKLVSWLVEDASCQR